MLQSIVAVLAGFALMVLIVMSTTVLLVRRLKVNPAAGPDALSAAYLAGNLVCSAIAALAGGWLAASLAPGRPLMHGVALAVLMVITTLFSMGQSSARQPSWYPVTLAIAMPLIACGGAWIESVGR